MLVAWAKHTGQSDASGRSAVAYLADEVVYKADRGAEGASLRRQPAPEVLRGDRELVCAAIGAVPFKYRYSSCVLSFAASDVDVNAFNAGDPILRACIREVIDGFEDTAFAGIPIGRRPPTFWTTHTHTGRLELNFLSPRAVVDGNGRLKALNAHPPGAESRALWDVFRSSFNLRFGWADPEDPKRQRQVKLPDWKAKQLAEQLRAGCATQPDLREGFLAWAKKAVAAGRIESRGDVIAHFERVGLAVFRTGQDYITVGDPGAPARERVRLRGPLFSRSFVSREALAEQAHEGPDEPAARLAAVEARLAELRQRRARYHRSRLLGPAWSAAAPDAALGLGSLDRAQPERLDGLPEAHSDGEVKDLRASWAELEDALPLEDREHAGLPKQLTVPEHGEPLSFHLPQTEQTTEVTNDGLDPHSHGARIDRPGEATHGSPGDDSGPPRPARGAAPGARRNRRGRTGALGRSLERLRGACEALQRCAEAFFGQLARRQAEACSPRERRADADAELDQEGPTPW